MSQPPSSSSPDVDGLRSLAVEVAIEAGTLLQGFAHDRAEGRDIDVSSKSSSTDPVSEADRAAERLIAERLFSARPDDGMLGEEDQAERTGSSGLTWIVDPLDGTVNFLYGLSAWSVSIAVVDADGPIAGAVHHPAMGETFHAARGRGAKLDDRSLVCSHVAEPTDTLVATGFAYDRAVRADQARMAVGLLEQVRDLRRAGSAALDLCWVAAGRHDAYLEFGLKVWDWAAGRLLVTEAGGVVSEHHRQLGGQERPGLVAGGRAAHDHLVNWLEDRS